MMYDKIKNKPYLNNDLLSIKNKETLHLCYLCKEYPFGGNGLVMVSRGENNGIERSLCESLADSGLLIRDKVFDDMGQCYTISPQGYKMAEQHNDNKMDNAKPHDSLQVKIDKFREKMIQIRVNLEVLTYSWLNMKNPSKEFMLSVLPPKMSEELPPAFNAIADIVISNIPREEKEIKAAKIMDYTISLIIQNHFDAQASG